jgi:hypothetical protein
MPSALGRGSHHAGSGRHAAQVDPVELGRHAVAIFDAARRRWAGQVDRLGGYEPMPSRRGTWVLHETDGQPDGLLCWRVVEHWNVNGDFGTVQVLEFQAASDTAYRNLWAYLAPGGIDELTRGALARADALFATPIRPWNATGF